MRKLHRRWAQRGADELLDATLVVWRHEQLLAVRVDELELALEVVDVL